MCVCVRSLLWDGPNWGHITTNESSAKVLRNKSCAKLNQNQMPVGDSYNGLEKVTQCNELEVFLSLNKLCLTIPSLALWNEVFWSVAVEQ